MEDIPELPGGVPFTGGVFSCLLFVGVIVTEVTAVDVTVVDAATKILGSEPIPLPLVAV